MPDQNCPNCGLINPDSALRCDCGYDFPSETVQESYLSRQERKKVKDRSLKVRSIVLGAFLGVIAASLLTDLLLSIGAGASAANLIFFGFFDLWVLVWIWWKSNKSGVKLGTYFGRFPAKSNWILGVLLSAGLYVFTIGCIFLFWKLLSCFAARYAESLFPPDRMNGDLEPFSTFPPQLLLLLITSPFVEELVFRGVVLRRWAAKWGVRKSIMLSSLVFAAIHPTDPIGSFFFGLVMACIFIRTGSLWVPIFCHSFYNAIPYLLKGIEYLLTGKVLFASEGWLSQQPWICLICLLAVGPWIVHFTVTSWPEEDFRIPLEAPRLPRTPFR